MARRECLLDIKRLVYGFFKKCYKIWETVRHLEACCYWSGFLDGEHVDKSRMAQQGFSTDIKSVFYIPQAKQDNILEHI